MSLMFKVIPILAHGQTKLLTAIEKHQMGRFPNVQRKLKKLDMSLDSHRDHNTKRD